MAQSRDTPDDAAFAAEFDLVVVAHERRLGQFLVQMLASREVAEDVLQETFLAAFRERQRLREVDNVSAWLFAIARNRALHALRTQRRREAGFRQLLALFRDAAADDPSEVVGIRALLERHLNADERALLILRYLHGFDANELGHIVDASPEAVRQRLSRLRRRLLEVDGDLAGAEPVLPSNQSGPERVEYRAEAANYPEDRRITGLLAPLARVTPVARRRPTKRFAWQRLRRGEIG